MEKNKKIKTTIKLDKHIKEKLDQYKKYGYNKNEIITMGIILLEDSKNFEILLNKTHRQDKTAKEIIKLKQVVDELNARIDRITYKNEHYKLHEIIKNITEEEIIPREQILHYNAIKLEPIGNEYFLEKEEQTGISKEKIIEQLVNEYTETYLKELNIMVK